MGMGTVVCGYGSQWVTWVWKLTRVGFTGSFIIYIYIYMQQKYKGGWYTFSDCEWSRLHRTKLECMTLKSMGKTKMVPVHYALCIVHCVLCIVCCMLCVVRWALCIECCVPCAVFCVLCIVCCTLCCAWCVVLYIVSLIWTVTHYKIGMYDLKECGKNQGDPLTI